jgi:tetratricopeptide (TPR) repeat protein
MEMSNDSPQPLSALDRLDQSLGSNKRWLYILFAGTLFLKLLYVIQSAGSLQVAVPIMDAEYYDEEAQRILRVGLLRERAFFMGPLYPFLLSLIYAIFGRDFMIVRILQVAAGALTVVLTYLLGKQVFRPSVALVGALILVLYGSMTFHEGEMLVTWLGTLINTAMLYVLYRGGTSGGYRKYALAGFLIGLSALGRANNLVFLPVLIASAVFVTRETVRFRKILVATAVTIITIAPATVHNYVASRDFVPITSNGGANFFIGNSQGATGIFFPGKELSFESESATRSHVERLFGRDMKPSEISRYWYKRSFEFIAKHPRRELRLLLRKTALFFNGYEVPQIESFEINRSKYLTLRLLFVRFWAVLSLGLFGMIFALRSWRKYFLLHGYVLSYALSIILFFVTARYRIQIAPVLCLFAGYSLLVVFPGVLRRLKSGVAATALFLAILSCTRPALFAFPEKEVKWRELVHDARRHSEAGQRSIALEEIDRAVELYPENPESYLQRAVIYKDAGNYFKAIDDYSKALKFAPDMPGVRYDFAQTLRRLKMYRPAIEEYEKAIALDPVRVEAYNNLGITYTELGDLGKAIECFEKALEIDDSYVKGYNNLGAALAERGELDRAIEVFSKAIRIAPDYANSYKNLAMAYVQLKRTKDAYDTLSRYHDLEPGDDRAAETLAKLRIALSADTTGPAPAAPDSAR